MRSESVVRLMLRLRLRVKVRVRVKVRIKFRVRLRLRVEVKVMVRMLCTRQQRRKLHGHASRARFTGTLHGTHQTGRSQYQVSLS